MDVWGALDLTKLELVWRGGQGGQGGQGGDGVLWEHSGQGVHDGLSGHSGEGVLGGHSGEGSREKKSFASFKFRPRSE